MRTRNKILISIIAIVIVIILMICWRVWRQHQRMLAKMNPKANKFITLYGHIAPKLNIVLQVVYRTTNKQCLQSDEWLLPDAYFAREKDLSYKLHPDSKNNYQIKLPLDKLQTGFCRWKADSIYYNIAIVTNPDGIISSWLLGFTRNATPIHSKTLNLVCKLDKLTQSGLACFYKNTHFDNANVPFSLTQLNANFYYGK